MTTHEPESWIEAYVGGELPPDRHRLMQSHLADCPSCRAAVALLESIRASARGLPRSIEPAGDLWPAITARLDARAVGSPASSPPGAAAGPSRDAAALRHRRTWTRTRPALAAAAVALIALGVTTWWIARPSSTVTEVASRPAAEGSSAGSLLGEFGETETAYLAAAAALESALATERAHLEPATAAVIDRNLRILDDAIGELRAAAVASPGDPEAVEFLADGYRRKVEVLRRLARISALASAEIRAEEAS